MTQTPSAVACSTNNIGNCKCKHHQHNALHAADASSTSPPQLTSLRVLVSSAARSRLLKLVSVAASHASGTWPRRISSACGCSTYRLQDSSWSRGFACAPERIQAISYSLSAKRIWATCDLLLAVRHIGSCSMPHPPRASAASAMPHRVTSVTPCLEQPITYARLLPQPPSYSSGMSHASSQLSTCTQRPSAAE
jgi:hypothetical protein